MLAGFSAGSAALAQSALFEARDVAAERFVLVAAPIGTGERSQLNIYEQIKDTRLCFSTSGSSPAQVEPLLGGFDFTGICSRYIDGNGYSLRVGGDDLASIYRLSVIRQGGDTLLLAAPTKAGAGPEMVVARSGGQGSGFLQLVFEPGWKLMRPHFGSRSLGHVYTARHHAARRRVRGRRRGSHRRRRRGVHLREASPRLTRRGGLRKLGTPP
ncbi:MAG: DUF3747 domain-containing protein [Prochlorococcaceae cyanobacterium]